MAATKYIKLVFQLNDILGPEDLLLVEKIIVNKEADVAFSLLNGTQPLYYMNNTLHMSTMFYEGGAEIAEADTYSIEMIDATQNIRNGATVLYDFEIDLITTMLYAYRLHLKKKVGNGYQTFSTAYASEFVSVTYADITHNKITKSYSESYTSKPNMIVRNLAYRGRNSLLKYNMTGKEYASDSKWLWSSLTSVTNMITENKTELVNIANTMRELHAITDQIQFIARFC